MKKGNVHFVEEQQSTGGKRAEEQSRVGVAAMLGQRRQTHPAGIWSERSTVRCAPVLSL